MDLFWPLWRYILEFGAVLAVAGILRMVGTWISRRAQNRARNWPYVYGTVEHAEPKMIGDGRTAHWIGELAFSYSVDGAYYSGFCPLPASGEDQAWNSVRGWKDRKVIVHYWPRNPSRSVLIVEEQDQPAPLLAEINLR